ncbi:MAG: hypothetical protein IH973_04310 [Myxococcales bacterium]|nr:hypothetical protein [Myxococcales bacterium]
MSSSTDSLEAIDFDKFHRSELPELLASGNGRLAAAALHRGSLAFRVDGGAYTYSRSENSIEIAPGDETAEVVIELSQENWSRMVRETMTAPGLLYGGKVKCLRGNTIKFVGWEPVLRAMYNGRPVWNPEDILLDRAGDPLDASKSFQIDDDREEMAHFLRTAGFLVVRNVFDASEEENSEPEPQPVDSEDESTAEPEGAEAPTPRLKRRHRQRPRWLLRRCLPNSQSRTGASWRGRWTGWWWPRVPCLQSWPSWCSCSGEQREGLI